MEDIYCVKFFSKYETFVILTLKSTIAMVVKHQPLSLRTPPTWTIYLYKHIIHDLLIICHVHHVEFSDDLLKKKICDYFDSNFVHNSYNQLKNSKFYFNIKMCIMI